LTPLPQVVLATCLERPELIPGDLLLAAALKTRGVSVGAAPWNGPFDPFARADLVVVRTTWDYPQHAAKFLAWLGVLETCDLNAVNAPALMRWNVDKSYLLDLEKRGVAIAPTRLAKPTATSIAEAFGALDVDEGVVKPLIGASGKGLTIVRRRDATSIAAAAAALNGKDALVQPLLPQIVSHGETSLIYFEGAFSHAVIKRASPGSILVQEEHGGVTTAAAPPPWLIAAGFKVLGALPHDPVYARIDGLELDGRFVLMEAELIEPDLFLTHDEGAPARYADALMRQLKA
jgi:hypothetical protein